MAKGSSIVGLGSEGGSAPGANDGGSGVVTAPVEGSVAGVELPTAVGTEPDEALGVTIDAPQAAVSRLTVRRIDRDLPRRSVDCIGGV